MSNKGSILTVNNFSNKGIVLTADALTDYLQTKQQQVKDQKIVYSVFEYMILGYGLHTIVTEMNLPSTLSLAERTIRRLLKDSGFDCVDKIMTNYYRLLLFPMLQAGESFLQKEYQEYLALETNKIFKVSAIFREGASQYLGTLTYNIASNFITMPIMFAYSPITTDLNQLSEFFSKLAKAQECKSSEFADQIGFDDVQLDSWISSSVKKMAISINDQAELIDDLTGEVITTINPYKN